MEYAPTCKPDNIQRGAVHEGEKIHSDNAVPVFVQLGEPDVSKLGGLLVEDWGEGLELAGSKCGILWGCGW